jgi:hypothetical protein
VFSGHRFSRLCATKEISMLEAFFVFTFIGAIACLITGAVDNERGG